MEIAVARLGGSTIDALAPLVREGEGEGWLFVRRLADEWRARSNQFDSPGEALFAAWAGDTVVGMCGLNADPYAQDPTVGRVRRLYVAQSYRGRGVGTRLVLAVVQAAAGRFRWLRVRTESPKAARLYERLGFAPVPGVPYCTHVLALCPDDISDPSTSTLVR